MSDGQTANRSQLYNVSLINSSIYFYETHYNIARYLIVTGIYHGELYPLQRDFIQAN